MKLTQNKFNLIFEAREREREMAHIQDNKHGWVSCLLRLNEAWNSESLAKCESISDKSIFKQGHDVSTKDWVFVMYEHWRVYI